MNKKKILSLILCCFMVLFVGCSSADSKVSEENSQVESQVEAIETNTEVKDIEDMDDEELTKYWVKQYLDFSKDTYQNGYSYEEREIIDKKYTGLNISEHEDKFKDTNKYNELISDIAELMSSSIGLQKYRITNNIKKTDIESSFYIYGLVEASDKLVEKYNLEYDLSYLNNAREYVKNNPIESRAMVEFANVKMKEDSDGYYTFIGEIINNNPSETFSGFGDVVLYKDEQVISKEPIVISEIAPDSKGVFETLPTNVDFDNYEMKITTPNWN